MSRKIKKEDARISQREVRIALNNIKHYEEELRDDGSESTASKIFLSRSVPLVQTGYKRPLNHEDLWRVPSTVDGEELYEKFERYWSEELKKSKPSVWYALRRSFQSTWIYSFLLLVAWALLAFVPSVILPFMLDYLYNPYIPDYYAAMFIVTVALAGLLSSFLYAHATFLSMVFALKVRSVLILLIYRKALALPQSQANSGQIVNLMSTDSQILADTIQYINLGLVAPIQIIVAIILISLQIGAFSLITLGIMVILFPINFIYGKKLGVTRMIAQQSTDTRVKLLTELIQYIKLIKYYAWEKPLTEKIIEARNEELKHLTEFGKARAIMIFTLFITPAVGTALTLIAYSLQNPFGVSEVFTTMSLLNLLRTPLFLLPFAMSQIFTVKASFERVQQFAMSPELQSLKSSGELNVKNSGAVARISIENGVFRWDQKTEEPTLKNINIKVKDKELAMVVGAVGSGKSSLCMAALGEIPKESGSVAITGDVAFVSQEAWIINGTVRDNILFGQPFDQTYYDKVINACALSRDLETMPNGDATEIGARGINLSGGQKQRISIARAVYSRREVYIFDDPLSAVDAHVSKHIFDNVINGLVKDKTVLLVTNQLQYLPYSTCIHFIQHGTVTESGSYADLLMDASGFSDLMQKFGLENAKKEKKSENEKEEAPQKQVAEKKEGAITMAEERETGFVSINMYYKYVMYGGAGLFLGFFIPLLLSAANQVVINWWLTQWTTNVYQQSLGFYLGIYAGLNVIEIVFAILIYLLNVYHGIESSRKLHDDFIRKVVRAPTGFFDFTPMGRIIGRMSKDLYLIDLMLPIQLLSFLRLVVSLLAVFAMLCFGSYYLVIAIVPLIGLYQFLQMYYRSTSIEVQRLESLSRAPIFSHFSETLSGTSVIRAYNLTEKFVSLNRLKVDINSRDFYIQKYVASWFGMVLDLIGVVIVSITFMAIVLSKVAGAVDPAFAALALSNTSGLTLILSSLNTNSADTEMRMNSVERLVSFLIGLPQEAPDFIEETKPPKDWPESGHIEFRDYSVAYNEKGGIVLRNLSAQIKPKEKIGIVGRTGAGKSTTLAALFRTLEATNGSIVIDGVDISTLGLNVLRSSISIIPQEPTLFIGTIRYNLDPFEQHTDEDLWHVLELVKLKGFIHELEGKLDAPISENGSNISVGQRQMLCMARALLRNTKILLLDEATASVDVETDALLQLMVREHFKDCTVLTIAHRLNTIMDSTRIMVLDQGRLVEFDAPINLLNDQDGYLHGMVAATGAKSAEYLRKIAMGQMAVVDVLRESASEQDDDGTAALLEKSATGQQRRKSSSASSSSSSSDSSLPLQSPAAKYLSSSLSSSSKDSSSDGNQ
jgi:ABC-type multidrug transport system fused ATPase/permease subunit